MARDAFAPQKYPLEDDFEALVVALCCTRPTFWNRVGRELDPDAMPTEAASIVLREMRTLVKNTTKPPVMAAVKQRLRNRWEEGKFKREVYDACVEVLRLAFAPSQDHEDNVVAELVPLLKRRATTAIIYTASNEFATSGDSEEPFQKTKDLIDRCRKIGIDEAVESSDKGIDLFDKAGFSFEEIEQLQSLERLPFGVPDLDIMLGGGFWKGCCAMLLASTGDGKSQTLGHVACEAVRNGRPVRVATLEDNRPLYSARLTANLTNWLYEDVLSRPKDAKRALLSSEVLGSLVVKYFDPDTTTFDEIADWAESTGSYDLLVVDYIDKLKSKDKKSGESSYMTGRDVAQSMRKYAEDREKWVITASQAKRRQDRKRMLDNDDVAESMHKVRIPQLVISLNYDKDTESVTYSVSKNRMGRGRFDVGPLPHDWARGRAVPLVG